MAALVPVMGSLELLRQPRAVLHRRGARGEALHECRVDVPETLRDLAAAGEEELADVTGLTLGVVLALGLDAEGRAMAALLEDLLRTVKPESGLVTLKVWAAD